MVQVQLCAPPSGWMAPCLIQLCGSNIPQPQSCVCRGPSQTWSYGLQSWSVPQPQSRAPLGWRVPQPQSRAPLGWSAPQPQSRAPLGWSVPQPQSRAPLGRSVPQPQSRAPLGWSAPPPPWVQPCGYWTTATNEMTSQKSLWCTSLKEASLPDVAARLETSQLTHLAAGRLTCWT